MPFLETIKGWFAPAPKTVAAQAAAGPATASGKPAPSDKSYAASNEPKYVAFTDWTPRHLRDILRYTDQSGDLRWLADLVDWILGDDRVKSAFHTRIGGLLGSPLSFEESANGGAIARRKAMRSIEAGEDFWELFPETELHRLMTWGLCLGVAFGRINGWVENKDHGGRLVPKIEVWHPRFFRWDHAKQQWLRDTGNGWVPVEFGQGEWFIYTPYGRSRPWASGLWRGLSVFVMLKVMAEADWGLRSEKQGQPTWVLTGEQSWERRKELAALIAELGRDPAVAMPNGVDAKLVESRAENGEIFEKQINLANTSFAVAITGGNLAVEAIASVQTGATAQTLVRIDYKRNDAAGLSTFCHDQVLVWWSEWNFGDAQAAVWPVWNVEPPENVQATATTWLTVAKAISAFRLAGITIDLKATAERFNIPITGMVELPAQGEPKKPEPDEEDQDDKADDEKASKDA